jgi:hypothetical protein
MIRLMVLSCPARPAAHIRAMRNAYNILVGKPEGMNLFRRARRRWEDNIKINLNEIGW